MSAFYSFMVILPLLTYVIVHRFCDLKKAIVSALCVAYTLAAVDAYLIGAWDRLLLSELALLTVFGALSIRLNNQRFFRFQPVITNLIFLFWLSWLQWFDEPIMIKYLPRLEAISADFAVFSQSEQGRQLLADSSLGVIFVLLIHTPLVAYSAYQAKDTPWFLARLSIYPMLIISTIVVSMMQ